MTEKSVDVVIIGSGVAGLMTAHLLADHMNVIMITKSSVEASNSSKAQGGMAAAIGELDHWKNHLQDTIEAGQNHHKLNHLEMVVKRAPEIVKRLQTIGVSFDRNKDGTLLLGMEGAHKKRRIVHAGGDQTGKAFTEALIHHVRNRIQIYEQTMVVSLIEANGEVIGVKTHEQSIYASAVVLATGGIGQLYTHTSNVKEATGDGFALALRAGATLVDMEFVQFHPTLFIKENKFYGLISEAVRGEGAFLINGQGKRLMDAHPLGDLAPRDVVSRAIFNELKQGNHVYLNCEPINKVREKFPGLYARCQRSNISAERMLLPVAPGAHFISGGIETDGWGQTSVKRLYAVGEVAFTGVHGANRLASNSLLEGFVFAEQVAAHIIQTKRGVPVERIPNKGPSETSLVKLPSKEEIKSKMTLYVGIEREENGLQQMKEWLGMYIQSAFTATTFESQERLEIKNMLLTAWLMTLSALERTESRGGHYRKDYPLKDDQYWSNTWLAHTKVEGLKEVTKKDQSRPFSKEMKV